MKANVYKVQDCKVLKVSIVGDPAIEYPFILRGNLLWGPVLVPQKKILRIDQNGAPFYLIFTSDIIAKVANDFNNTNINFEHSGVAIDLPIITNGVTTEEMMCGGILYPKGTWMLGLKIDGKNAINLLRNNILNGFSIEAEVEY